MASKGADFMHVKSYQSLGGEEKWSKAGIERLVLFLYFLTTKINDFEFSHSKSQTDIWKGG